MEASVIFRVMAVSMALVLIAGACANDEAGSEPVPSPTPAEETSDQGKEPVALEDLDNGSYVEAISSAAFTVQVPGELPFEVVDRNGSIQEGPGEGAPTTLTLMYIPDNEGTFIEIRQMDTLSIAEGEHVEDVELLDGTPAQFSDNEVGTSISWQDEEYGVSITVGSGREDNRLSLEHLLEIAASMEPIDHDPAAAEETDIAEAPCEVRELEPPRDDAPESDPERIEEWLETAMSFNEVAIGPDGERYIGSYRHAAVLVVDADGSLHDVWTDGVRNTHPQIVMHPDDRIILLQDNGIHFYEPDGTHQKYLSMFDGDAGGHPGIVSANHAAGKPPREPITLCHNTSL